MKISKPKIGEAMNYWVAKHVFNWSDEALSNEHIPLPDYSNSRLHAESVLAKLEGCDAFQAALCEHLDSHYPDWKQRPTAFAHIHSYEICVIAFSVVSQSP